MDVAQVRRAAGAGLDRVVEGVEGAVRRLHADHEPVRRVPGRDRRPLGRRGAGGDLHPRRELPGRGVGGDRGPDVVRGGGQVDLAGDLECAAHDWGSLFFVMVGCRATTNRCGRPPAAASSWYFATRPLTASASSAANAARSLRGREPHLAVDPERRERLAGRARPGDELADLADQAPRDREQPARGALVRLARRIRRDRRQGGRRDHVGRGRRLEHALGAVALAALLDELHQAVALQRPQVVVRLLAGQPDARRERAGGPGLGQLGEQAGPDRIQRRLGGGGVVDDGDVVHGRTFSPTTIFVKQIFLVGRILVYEGDADASSRRAGDRRSRRSVSAA